MNVSDLNVKEVEAYKTPDGEVFEDEHKAQEHCKDLIGMELDGLLQIALSSNERLAGNITRIDQYALAMEWLDNLPALRRTVYKLNKFLNESF